MEKKLLIDLDRLRENRPGEPSDKLMPEGVMSEFPNKNGRKSIRELAVFRYTCRKCEDAPCIDACPADALDKDGEGIVRRSTNLCISCRSCVVMCPFGTIMNDFFEHHRTPENYFDLSDPKELQAFIDNNPQGAVSLVEMEEDPSKNIFKLNDRVLIREKDWQGIKSNRK
ncbi:MAG: 4Fe-4S dicluster domain-containing protein [Bacteroidales bacterium]